MFLQRVQAAVFVRISLSCSCRLSSPSHCSQSVWIRILSSGLSEIFTDRNGVYMDKVASLLNSYSIYVWSWLSESSLVIVFSCHVLQFVCTCSGSAQSSAGGSQADIKQHVILASPVMSSLGRISTDRYDTSLCANQLSEYTRHSCYVA